MKQDKGCTVTWAVLKCTFLSYVTRPYARLIHKNMCTWGIWAATVQGMQQEQFTFKDLTEMNRAVAWGCHVQWLIVFTRQRGALQRAAHPCKWAVHCSSFWPCFCPQNAYPCSWRLWPGGGCTAHSVVGVLCFADWLQQASSFWKMRSQPLFPVFGVCCVGRTTCWPAEWTLECRAWSLYTNHMPKSAPPGPSTCG